MTKRIGLKLSLASHEIIFSFLSKRRGELPPSSFFFPANRHTLFLMILRPPSFFQTAASCFNLQPRCTNGASSQILLRCYLCFDLNRIFVHLISTLKLRLNRRTTLSSTPLRSATKAAAAEVSTAEKTGPLNAVESTSKSALGIEDLFNDSFSVTPSLSPVKPQKDVKNDIMSLFEKSNIVSPFAMHQQQLAMLAQHQSLLMAAASKSSGVDLKYPTGIQQPSSNVSVQNWPHTGFSNIWGNAHGFSGRAAETYADCWRRKDLPYSGNYY